MSLFFTRPRLETRDIDGAAFDTFMERAGATGTAQERALRLIPVYSATSLLADSVASLPIQSYEVQPNGDRQRIATTGLLEKPAAYGTLYDWVHRLMTSLLLRGNAYGLEVASDAGWPTMIEWLNPDLVEVDESKGTPLYRYRGRELDPLSVTHVVGYATAGTCLGQTPVRNFAEAIDTGLYAQEKTRNWYRDGATPTHALRNTAKTLSAEQAQATKSLWRSSQRTGDPFVSGADWELTPVGISAADAAFLDAIKANATQVAAIYRVPPEKIGGETGSSMTYATTEQQTIDFITHSLRPWLVRIEHALKRIMRPGTYARFNADAMIRTDLLSRWQVHEIALRTQATVVNEVRELEDRPPVPWGNEPVTATPAVKPTP